MPAATTDAKKPQNRASEAQMHAQRREEEDHNTQKDENPEKLASLPLEVPCITICGLPWTTKTIIFVGSYYKALYINYR